MSGLAESGGRFSLSPCESGRRNDKRVTRLQCHFLTSATVIPLRRGQLLGAGRSTTCRAPHTQYSSASIRRLEGKRWLLGRPVWCCSVLFLIGRELLKRSPKPGDCRASSVKRLCFVCLFMDEHATRFLLDGSHCTDSTHGVC